MTYHPQELAFFSWFYGPDTSTGVNDTFSFSGTFTRPAPLCPPGGHVAPHGVELRVDAGELVEVLDELVVLDGTLQPLSRIAWCAASRLFPT